ncbi:MAG: DUF2332 domain-containing protein [Novosphingobium sp.]|nr:DUF2332 domain-containing protein [Novosphingobium sp.]
MAVTTERMESVAAAFRTGAQSYGNFGATLYSVLCAGGADDPDIIELAAHAQAGAQPVFHLLTVIHYLVLGSPHDPLGRYFATLHDPPRPADEAWPEFTRFCRERRSQIVDTLASTTVQTTFADRCATMVPLFAFVADRVGEPLNLIEIGCSAGVLLTFDRYAYAYKNREPFGAQGAPLTFTGEFSGDPPLRLPLVGSRTGLDLHPVHADNADERRWLIALIFPEFRKQREELATALEVVAQTDIRLVEGDALNTLPGVLAETADPVCIFHSVCLSYWTEEARAALDAMLIEASRTRTIHRVGSEPSARFSAWNKGHNRSETSKPPPSGELTIARYAGGVMDSRIVGTNGFGEPVTWLGWEGKAST